MNFFMRQDETLSKSKKFYAAFCLALLMSVGLLYFVLTGCMMAAYFAKPNVSSTAVPQTESVLERTIRHLPNSIYGSPPRIISARPIIIIGSFIMCIMLTASLIRTQAIKKGGGAYVAELLGGREVIFQRSLEEKRLVNIVEEMALASGLPRPRIYILPHEHSINAVTAGLSHDDAIIAVTRGSLDHLSKDELQGVIAHEFAHILNGDCALNLTMAGWLYGLLAFSIAGWEILKFVLENWCFSVTAAGKALKGQIVLAVPVGIIGLLLLAGGSIGKLSASLIQAAFSRQREFLADAFAVQFTRNPLGLAGALIKISNLSIHGFILNAKAVLMENFFIVTPTSLRSLLQTHPPIEERIYAIDSSWDGTGEAIEVKGTLKSAAPESTYGTKLGKQAQNLEIVAGRRADLAESLNQLQESWGSLLIVGILSAGDKVESNQGGQSLKKGSKLYLQIPESLRKAVKDPAEADLLVAAMFLQDGEDQNLAAAQASIIRRRLGEEAFTRALAMKAEMSDCFKLPLLELSAATLRGYSQSRKNTLGCAVNELIASDGRLDLFEVAAWQMIRKYLGIKTESKKNFLEHGLENYRREVQKAAIAIISILAYLGARSETEAAAAFQAGMRHFTQWPEFSIQPRLTSSTKNLSLLFDCLESSGAKIKNQLVMAAIDTAMHDQTITQKEYELLRALAAAFDVPLPVMNLAETA